MYTDMNVNITPNAENVNKVTESPLLTKSSETPVNGSFIAGIFPSTYSYYRFGEED